MPQCRTPTSTINTRTASMGSYTLAVSGSWAATPLTCQSKSIQLSQALSGSCTGVSFVSTDLFQSSAPVAVTPQLPTALAFAPGSYAYTATSGGASCSFTVTVAGCARCQGMLAELLPDHVTQLRRRGKWRVKQALLRVTDSTGLSPGRISVRVTWTVLPAPEQSIRSVGSRRVAATVVTKQLRARKTGPLALTSPSAPRGGSLQLALEAVWDKKSGACTWLQQPGEVAGNFTCDIAGC